MLLLVSRLPLSLIVPLPLTASETMKEPAPEYEASLLTVVVTVVLPGSVQLPLASSLSVQLPPMMPVTVPEAEAVPLALPVTVVEAESGTKKETPLAALLSV
jgi:hypothetical protein